MEIISVWSLKKKSPKLHLLDLDVSKRMWPLSWGHKPVLVWSHLWLCTAGIFTVIFLLLFHSVHWRLLTVHDWYPYLWYVFLCDVSRIALNSGLLELESLDTFMRMYLTIEWMNITSVFIFHQLCVKLHYRSTAKLFKCTHYTTHRRVFAVHKANYQK